MKCVLWKNGTCTRETDALAAEAVKDKMACYVPKSVYKEYNELQSNTKPEAQKRLRMLRNKYQ